MDKEKAIFYFNYIGPIVCMFGVIGLIIYGITSKYIDKKEIHKHPEFTIGYIYETHRGRSGDGLHYYYYVKDKKYYASSGVSIDYVIVHVKNLSQLEGKYFPVAYSSKNPDKSEILLFPEHFDKFNMEYPDSLRGIIIIQK